MAARNVRLDFKPSDVDDPRWESRNVVHLAEQELLDDEDADSVVRVPFCCFQEFSFSLLEMVS